MWKIVDARVHNLGSFFAFELLSDAAVEWWDENVCTDSTYAEGRYAWSIAQGMQSDGLTVI